MIALGMGGMGETIVIVRRLALRINQVWERFVEPPATWAEFELAERDGATELRMTHGGWGEGERWDAARAWQLGAWSAALTRLLGQT